MRRPKKSVDLNVAAAIFVIEGDVLVAVIHLATLNRSAAIKASALRYSMTLKRPPMLDLL